MSDANHAASQIDPEVLELIREFVVESRDVVSESEPALVQLEQPGSDVDAIGESVSAVFRMFHSMKGSAGLLELASVEKITHAAESLLAGIRDARIVPDPRDVDALCQALDCINQLLACVEQTFTDKGCEELVERTHERLLQAMQEFDARQNAGAATPEQTQSSQAGTTKATPEQLADFRDDALHKIEQLEAFLLSGEFSQSTPEQLEDIAGRVQATKQRAGELNLRTIELLGHAIQSTIERSAKAQAPIGTKVVKSLHNALNGLRDAINGDINPRSIESIDPYISSLRPFTPPQEPSENALTTTKLGELLIEQGALSRADLDDALAWQNKRLGEIIVDLHMAEPEAVQHAIDIQQGKAPYVPAKAAANGKTNKAGQRSGKPTGTKNAASSKNTSSGTIRVDLHKLDALLDQVGELITAAETVAQRPELRNEGAEQLLHSVWHLTRITSGLHDTAMSMRMVPVRPTFRKVLRVVRDVSKKVGKKIEVTLAGEDTEIDKTVVEAIADPLMHIIRNAVDHGIETPEKRLAAGKPERGTIHLSSHHEGGDVFINVQDDGAGIDPQKLINRAKERGLISPDIETMPRSEAYELLFKPGFSTAAQVTDISGRGVGMDVVRRNIEAVRGRVQINSEVGKGSTFSIRIPLTLAIIDGMLVRVGKNLYAVPLLSIRESVRVGEQAKVQFPDGREMVKLRGDVFPVLRLHAYHKVPDAETRLDQGILVMVENEGRSRCLFVDEILGQRQIVVKALDNHLVDIRGVSGCSITGTGEICLILDVHQLLSDAAEGTEQPAIGTSQIEFAA